MPYCSLEEAWGGNFTTDDKSENSDVQIPFSNVNSNEDEYMSINYDETSFNDNKVKNKLFRRNMSRLANHSGPTNRYISQPQQSKISYTNNTESDWYPKKELVMDAPVSYLNLDVPINKYDNEFKNELLSKQIRDDNYNYNNIIDETFLKEKSTSKNKGNYQEDLEREEIVLDTSDNSKYNSDTDDNSTDIEYKEGVTNEHKLDPIEYQNASRKTNNIVRKKHKSNDNITYKSYNSPLNDIENDDIYDIVIYISTGIFIIFILDIFTKLGKSRS